MSKELFFAAVVSATISFASLSQAHEKKTPDSKADIRGTVKMISPAAKGSKDLLGAILVEGPRGKKGSIDKASIRITPKTKIFKQVGMDRKMVRFEDLKVGQQVEARFIGPVAESYPVQARAAEIVILADEKKEQDAGPASR